MSSSARSAVDLPAPETPVTTTTLMLVLLRTCSLLNLVDVWRAVALLPVPSIDERAIEPILKLTRRVLALELQQQVAGGHFDDGRNRAAGPDRDAQHRHRHLEDRVPQLLDAQPVV